MIYSWTIILSFVSIIISSFCLNNFFIQTLTLVFSPFRFSIFGFMAPARLSIFFSWLFDIYFGFMAPAYSYSSTFLLNGLALVVSSTHTSFLYFPIVFPLFSYSIFFLPKRLTLDCWSFLFVRFDFIFIFLSNLSLVYHTYAYLSILFIQHSKNNANQTGAIYLKNRSLLPKN